MVTPALTQERLAELVGVSQGFYSRLESGARQPDRDVLRAIATQLGVPVAAITYPAESCPVCAKTPVAA